MSVTHCKVQGTDGCPVLQKERDLLEETWACAGWESWKHLEVNLQLFQLWERDDDDDDGQCEVFKIVCSEDWLFTARTDLKIALLYILVQNNDTNSGYHGGY